ncbi:MAG TPA: carbonic anhydrase [Fimbriiglobus sp.]|nr:carbonic anhydrase [Fimbriiglobus sp.]
MEKLIRGIHKFQSDVFRAREDMFHSLVGGQNPQALFIGCSDSRMVPDLICQTDPGDLFVIRNAGNLVPPYTPGAVSGEAATIEYAIRGLGVKDVIVCGHTKCGAMQAAMNPDSLKDMPRVRQWLSNADASNEIVVTQYSHLPDDARWQVMAQENVLVQLENLRTHPSVLVGLAHGDIRLHAWMYKLETGQVFRYDAETGQYVPLVRHADSGSMAPLTRNGSSRLPAYAR